MFIDNYNILQKWTYLFHKIPKIRMKKFEEFDEIVPIFNNIKYEPWNQINLESIRIYPTYEPTWRELFPLTNISSSQKNYLH
jgi:hypothetical protein